jgi:hypothetical protein
MTVMYKYALGLVELWEIDIGYLKTISCLGNVLTFICGVGVASALVFVRVSVFVLVYIRGHNKLNSFPPQNKMISRNRIQACCIQKGGWSEGC